MTTKLLTTDTWPRITSLVKKQASKCHIAVAYFSTDGAEMLPLVAGSTLVVDMGPMAVKSGQTNPSAIIKLLKKGVTVYSVQNLHAKAFVIGERAIVGSANASNRSANQLFEAAIDTSIPSVVKSVRRFVKSQTGEPVTLEHAKNMEAIYEPPQFLSGPKARRARLVPAHSPIWAVALSRGTWTESAVDAEKTGMPFAKAELQSSHFYKIDTFNWFGKGMRDKLRKGDLVLQIMKGRPKTLCPVGRVVRIERYKERNSQQIIVFLETRKRLKQKPLSQVETYLGTNVGILRRLRFARLLRNRQLVHDLLHLWPELSGK